MQKLRSLKAVLVEDTKMNDGDLHLQKNTKQI